MLLLIKKCLESVQKIGGDDGYLDLMLIHNVTSGSGIKSMWLAMEKLYKDGQDQVYRC